MNEELLLKYLKTACIGRSNTKSGTHISLALNISGNELRRMVNRLRKKGVPVGSGKDGYFYAVTAGEVYTTIRQLKTMSQGLEAAIRGLEQSLDSFGVDHG